MKKIFLYLILTFFILNKLYAIDTFDAEFDSAFKTEKKEYTKKNKKYFISVNRNLKFRTYFFFKKTHYKYRLNSQLYNDLLVELNTKIRKDNHITSMTLFALAGTDDKTYSYEKIMLNEFRDTDDAMPIVGIKELYMLTTHEKYDITIGKKIFNPGLSTIYSPANIYDDVLAPDPLDPYTLGVWLTQINYYINSNSNYNFIFIPFISKPKISSPQSRWSGNYYPTNYENYDEDNNSSIKEDKTNHVRALIQYKNTIQNVDTSIIIGYGTSIYKILEYTSIKDKYLLTNPSVIYISSGFSTTYEQFELHGEAYYQYVLNGEDDNIISAVIGSTYTLDKWVNNINLEKIISTIEFTKIIVTKDFTSNKTYKSSKNTREPKKDILIKIDAKINYKLSIKYLADFRLSTNNNDSGYYQKIGSSYKFKPNLNGSVYFEFFNGEKDSFYRKWADNNRIIFQLQYSF